MTQYLYLFFFGIIGPLVTSHNVLTPLEFLQWRCSSICTNTEMKKHVKGICLQIETDLEDRNQDNAIKSFSQCKKDISVEFKENETVLIPGYPREVGMCYLSDTVTKCITKGSKENSVFIFSYIDRACRDPQEFDYNFSIPPFVGLFITPLQFIQWKCSIICKNSDFEKHVIKICSQLSNEVPMEVRFETDKMSAMSGCKNEVSVEFEIENEQIFSLGFRETVAMCHLSPKDIKCITKGPKDKSVFVFSYTNNVCHAPQQIDYDFGFTSFSTNEEDTGPYTGIAQLLASNIQTSIPAIKGGDTANAEIDQAPISGTSSSILAIEKAEPAIAKPAQSPISGTSVSRAPSADSSVSRVSTPTKKKTISEEKPLQSSPTVTQSPSKKQNPGIWGKFVAWVKSLF